VDLSPDPRKIRYNFSILDDDLPWLTPAIVGGTIRIRNFRFLCWAGIPRLTIHCLQWQPLKMCRFEQWTLFHTEFTELYQYYLYTLLVRLIYDSAASAYCPRTDFRIQGTRMSCCFISKICIGWSEKIELISMYCNVINQCCSWLRTRKMQVVRLYKSQC
jgi:hypothetical protein